MKEKRDWFRILVGLAAVSAIIWFPYTGLNYVFNYLTDYYYVYLNWPMMVIGLVSMGLWIAAMIWYLVKLQKYFYVLTEWVQIAMIIGSHLTLYFIAGNIFYNVILSIPMGVYAARRVNALPFKNKDEALTELYHLLKINLAVITVVGIIFIISQIMVPGLVVSVAENLGLSSIYIAAFIVIIGMAVAGAGVIILFRVLFLRCANWQMDMSVYDK